MAEHVLNVSIHLFRMHHSISTVGLRPNILSPLLMFLCYVLPNQAINKQHVTSSQPMFELYVSSVNQNQVTIFMFFSTFNLISIHLGCILPLKTHQFVIGGIGVIIWVGFGDPHGHAVGKNGK